MLSSKDIREYVSAVILLLVLTVASIFPAAILSVLCSAASIAILGYLTTKFHYGYVAGAALSICIVYVLLMQSVLAALISALPVVFCGLSLGISKNISLSPLKTISIVTAVYTLNVTANLKLTTALFGQNSIETALETAGLIYREAISAAYGAQMSENEISAIVSETISSILQLTPAFLIIMCFAFSLLAFYLFKRICMIRKADITPLTAFSDWRAEKGISIIFFILLVATLLLPAGTLWTDAILNLVTIMSVVFFMFGLSLLEHILIPKVTKSGKRKFILVCVALLTLLFVGVPFLIISVAGAMDGIMDYRKKMSVR